MDTTTRPSTARLEEFDEFDTFDSEFGGEPDKDERLLGMLSHLTAFAGFVVPFGNIVGPLVLYLAKKDESEFVADQARESLNFQITATIALVLSIILMIALVGFITTPILGIAWLVLTIVGGIKANDGERYRYPLNVRFVK